MSCDATEHDPLLRTTIPADESRTKGNLEKTRIGPLELSRSTRYGILAGIWTATFVSVSVGLHHGFSSHCFCSKALNRTVISFHRVWKVILIILSK